MIKIAPDFSFEAAAHLRGFRYVAGVDEVGRGPLAGPVVAAAVILDPDDIPDGLNDSKTMTAKRREALFDQIEARAVVCIAEATVAEIEAVNILQASHLAMLRAVLGLAVRADYALIDGKQVPSALTLQHEAVVRGDARSLSIAAASIMAKVWRDRLMVDLAQQHPHYGWERNAGYPTPEHKAGLKCHGVSPHHRRTFRPIHNILWQG